MQMNVDGFCGVGFIVRLCLLFKQGPDLYLMSNKRFVYKKIKLSLCLNKNKRRRSHRLLFGEVYYWRT